MSSDAARLEALGEPNVRLRWRSHDLVIPRALEAWPLDDLRAGRYVDACEALLDGQTAPFPRYGDLVELSDCMAAAIGIERLPETKPVAEKDCGSLIFGAIPLLLGLLDHYEDDIAADLKERFGVEYGDRWRGTLTLRQIWTYVRRSHPTSALAIARNGGHELWSKQAIITAQVWEMLSRKVYVGRPMTREEIAVVTEKQRAAQSEMDRLAAKQDYYGPEASRARYDAWLAKKAAESGAPVSANEPPPIAMGAAERAMAARRREITTRKAG